MGSGLPTVATPGSSDESPHDDRLLQRTAVEVNRRQHGYMNGHSGELRGTIGSAVEHGMSKAQAARTFDVSLTSVRRYVDKARQGGPLAPKKSPGSTPKLDQRANKLSKEDIRERPYVTLQERHDYMEAVRGIWVSRSTLCRAIARIGPTSKKGGRVATERYEFATSAGPGARWPSTTPRRSSGVAHQNTKSLPASRRPLGRVRGAVAA